MIAADSRRRVIAAALFVVCAVGYTALGLHVSHVPPAGIDAAARGLAGESPRLAWIFTASCLWPALSVFGIAGAFIAWRSRAWRARIVFAIITTMLTWQLSNVLKDAFTRPRPPYWIVYHETSYAYSSGHAMFAVLVYWLWAANVARAGFPPLVRIPLALFLVAWGAGVIWSRLALGAHYPTDLLGGILLACGALSLATVVASLVAPRARLV